MRVLIGNVDPDLNQLLSVVLQEAIPGLQVDAVDKLEKIDDRADLYLLILNNIGPFEMPVSERAERVLLRAQELHAPVIALAGAPDDAQERALAAGIRHFFWLPFDVRELLEAVRREIGGDQSKQPGGSCSM